MNIWKYKLVTESGELISRHKTLEKATLAKTYCKTCVNAVIKSI